MNRSVLVVGGAGYIGSHCVKELAGRGYSVVTLDNLVHGHRDAVQWGEFVQGDLGDPATLQELFRKHDFAGVMHFAAYIAVGESVVDPEKYYRNNVANTLTLLGEMRRAGIGHFIFSSTCATYGEPQQIPMTEEHPQLPISPYGASKHMVERMLLDFAPAYGLQSTIFRYFNAAGADPDGQLGERHDPETHLIPLVLRAAMGRQELHLFGTDYPTVDGTCVRDYIHVTDLAAAHVLGLERMLAGGGSAAYNLGNGAGYSNKQVIETASRVTGCDIPYTVGPRRAGDSPALVGSSAKAVRELGWSPRFASLEAIVSTAWEWHRREVAGG